MSLSGRPLIDTAVDSQLYLPRPEHRMVRASAEQSLNVLVSGPPGSGKTTMLRQVLRELREAGHAAVFLDGKLASDAASFLELVRFQIGSAPNLPQAMRETYSQVLSPRRGLGDAGALLGLIESMRGVESERTTLLIDGLPSAEIAHALFGQLRDELWQLPFNWIVAVDERERSALLQPPANAFFERKHKLGRLAEDEALELLRRRVDDRVTTATLSSLVAASDGNPRHLLALTRDALIDGEPVESLIESRVRREAAASTLSRPASMLLAELESLGSASASDEELLRRLGWTRPRATQVFADLEAAGLVTSREVSSGGGRPRKVFQPSDPEAAP